MSGGVVSPSGKVFEKDTQEGLDLARHLMDTNMTGTANELQDVAGDEQVRLAEQVRSLKGQPLGAKINGLKLPQFICKTTGL